MNIINAFHQNEYPVDASTVVLVSDDVIATPIEVEICEKETTGGY